MSEEYQEHHRCTPTYIEFEVFHIVIKILDLEIMFILIMSAL